MKDFDATSARDWKTESAGYSGEYDIERYYTRSVDEKGHRSQVRVSLPPTVVRMINTMVARQQVPAYQTAGDFMRDAAYHRLQWLTDNWDQLEDSEELQAQRIMASYEQTREREARAQAFVLDAKRDIAMTQGRKRDSYVAHAREMLAFLPSEWAEELEQFLGSLPGDES